MLILLCFTSNFTCRLKLFEVLQNNNSPFINVLNFEAGVYNYPLLFMRFSRKTGPSSITVHKNEKLSCVIILKYFHFFLYFCRCRWLWRYGRWKFTSRIDSVSLSFNFVFIMFWIPGNSRTTNWIWYETKHIRDNSNIFR